MRNIVTVANTQVNSQIQKTDYTPSHYVPRQEYNQIKSTQYKHIELICQQKNYNPRIEKILKTLVGNSHCSGLSSISRQTIAKINRCHIRTVHRIMARLRDDGVISCAKNGWKVSNTTTILVVQHLNYNKSDILSHSINSSNTEERKDIRHKNSASCSEIKIGQEERLERVKAVFESRKALDEAKNPEQHSAQPPKQKIEPPNRPVAERNKPNLYKHKPYDLIDATIDPVLSARIEDKFTRIEHQNEVKQLAKELKCTEKQKMLIVNRLAERNANAKAPTIKSLGAVMMDTFKRYLCEIGDEHNVRNRDLKPKRSELQKIYQPPIMEVPYEIEVSAITKVQQYWIDSGRISMETLCTRISDTQTLGDLLIWNESAKMVNGQNVKDDTWTKRIMLE